MARNEQGPSVSAVGSGVGRSLAFGPPLQEDDMDDDEEWWQTMDLDEEWILRNLDIPDSPVELDGELEDPPF